MEKVKYMLKPDWVSWESIHDCVAKASEINRKNGFCMQHSTMSVQELEDYLKDGYCFIALLGEKVIGINALKIVKSQMWWAKGNVGYEMLTDIDPEYKNTGAYWGLRKIRTNFARQQGVSILQFTTSEDNTTVQEINLRFGFKYIRYYSSSETWYYSVLMVRWIDGCPYSDWYCDFRFKLSRFLTRLIWRPGRIINFWPLRDRDYQRIYNNYQLCSDMMSKEEFCSKMAVNYKSYKKWEKNHMF